MKKDQYQALESKFLYGFGFFMALCIIGGTFFSSQQVQKHDQAHQYKANQNIARPSSPPNPFRDATHVTLKVPYRHGRNKDTLNYIAFLKQNSTQSLPKQGFALEGTYISLQGQKKPCQLRFHCPSSTCFMEVDIDTRHFLRPYYRGSRRATYPERNFAILSHGYVIEVEKSKIVGIGKEDQKDLALFEDSVDLSIAYSEIYKTETEQ